MAWPRVHCDPSAPSAFAVAHQVARRQWRREHACAMEREGNRAGAIVTVIVKRAVTTAPNIWLPAQCVRRPDCVLHILRRPRRRVSDPVPQHRPTTRYRGSISPPFDLRCRFILPLLVLIPVLIFIISGFSLRPRHWHSPGALICHSDWLRRAISLILLFVVIRPRRASHYRSDRRRCYRSQNTRRPMSYRCGYSVHHGVDHRERLQGH